MMEHVNNNVLAVFAILLLLFSVLSQVMLYQEVGKIDEMKQVTGKVTGTGTISLRIKYPFTGAGFTAEVAEDNESIYLQWENDGGDNYSLYVADNASQEFYLLAEGLTIYNYTDTDAGNYSERYYMLERFEEGLGDNSTKIVGKYEINLTTANGRWNYVSLPVNPVNTSVSEVLKTIDGQYEWIYEYDSPTASFRFWFGGFGTITDLTSGKCFIIQPFQNTTLTVAGDDYRHINESLLTNDGRWNYVGWVNTIAVVADATTSIAGFDWIYEYLSSTGAFNFYFGGGGTITDFAPAKCYIIQPTVNNSVLSYTK